MMSPRPYSALSLRHFARISRGEMVAESSMNSFDCDRSV